CVQVVTTPEFTTSFELFLHLISLGSQTVIILGGVGEYAATFASGCCNSAAQKGRRDAERLVGGFAGVPVLREGSELQNRCRSSRPDRHDVDAQDRPAGGRTRLQAVSARPIWPFIERRRPCVAVRRGTDGTPELQRFPSRVALDRDTRLGAGCRHRGTWKLLGPAPADRFPEDLSQDHGRSSLRNGAG